MNVTEQNLIEEFSIVEDAFNQAIISNDVEKIAACISTDWVIVDPQGGIIPRERFMYVVENGILSHSAMSKEILRVKIYGNTAVVTGRGKNAGMFQGQPIQAEEWVTDIYHKEGEKWLCVLTHLSPVTSQ
jgi:ketosteroid isomerase-like protein